MKTSIFTILILCWLHLDISYSLALPHCGKINACILLQHKNRDCNSIPTTVPDRFIKTPTAGPTTPSGPTITSSPTTPSGPTTASGIKVKLC